MEAIKEAAKNYVINLSENNIFGKLKEPKGAGVELCNAFLAGATFMQQSAMLLAKSDFNFICEIIDDLKKNGYTEDGMAAVMLNDWRGELEEKINEE